MWEMKGDMEDGWDFKGSEILQLWVDNFWKLNWFSICVKLDVNKRNVIKPDNVEKKTKNNHSTH